MAAKIPPPAAATASGGAAAFLTPTEWYDPWPAGLVHATTDLWSWLAHVDGPTVAADAVIHLSRRCVGEGHHASAHVDSTCTACDLSLQVHRVRPHG